MASTGLQGTAQLRLLRRTLSPVEQRACDIVLHLATHPLSLTTAAFDRQRLR